MKWLVNSVSAPIETGREDQKTSAPTTARFYKVFYLSATSNFSPLPARSSVGETTAGMIAARLPWDASIAARILERWKSGCSGADCLMKLPPNLWPLRCIDDLTADAYGAG